MQLPHPDQAKVLAHLNWSLQFAAGFMQTASDTPARNAAIALARLARDEACKAQLRELDALRIMYQKIKP